MNGMSDLFIEPFSLDINENFDENNNLVSISATPSEWKGFWTPFQWSEEIAYLRELSNLDIVKSPNPKEEFSLDYDFLTGKAIQVRCVACYARGGDNIEVWAFRELLRSGKCFPKTFGNRKIAIEYVEGSMVSESRCENSTIDENDPEYQNFAQLWYFKFACKWTLLEPFTVPDDAKKEPSSFKNILRSYSLEDVCQAVFNYFETGVKPVVIDEEIKKRFPPVIENKISPRQEQEKAYIRNYVEMHKSKEDDENARKMMEMLVEDWRFELTNDEHEGVSCHLLPSGGIWRDYPLYDCLYFPLFKSSEPKKDISLVYDFLRGKRVKIPGTQLHDGGGSLCKIMCDRYNLEDLERIEKVAFSEFMRQNKCITGTFANRKIAIEFIEDSLEIAPGGGVFNLSVCFYATLLEPFTLPEEAKNNLATFQNNLKDRPTDEEFCQAVYNYCETGVKPTASPKISLKAAIMHCERLVLDYGFFRKRILIWDRIRHLVDLPACGPYENYSNINIYVGLGKVDFEIGPYSTLKENNFVETEDAIDVCGAIFKKLKKIVESREFASIDLQSFRHSLLMDIESNPQDYVNSRDKTIARYAQFCMEERQYVPNENNSMCEDEFEPPEFGQPEFEPPEFEPPEESGMDENIPF